MYAQHEITHKQLRVPTTRTFNQKVFNMARSGGTNKKDEGIKVLHPVPQRIHATESATMFSGIPSEAEVDAVAEEHAELMRQLEQVSTQRAEKF
jgi:hypothetical protein